MAEEIKESFEAEENIISDGKVWSIMAYLGILCLLPLLLKKENKFALFHGKQGLVLFIGEVAISVLSLGISIFAILWPLGFFVFGSLSIVGIIQVLMGKYWKMPIVYEIAEKFKI